MRGWQALTRGWERPIQPMPPERKAGRQPLLSAKDRALLIELNKRAKAVQAEIDAVFARNGINREQSAHQLRSIRRGLA